MSATTEPQSIVIVSTQEEFDAAYIAMTEGEGGTILVEATTTYTLQAYDGKGATDASVTIRSADIDAPATFGAVRLDGSENLTLENLNFHMDGDDDVHRESVLRISNSSNITVRESTITSDADGPLGTVDGYTEAARGATVRNSTGVTFENNEMTNLMHALAFFNSYQVTVTNNDLSAMQGDGIRIGGVQGAMIEGNHIHDMIGATHEANHADMIQIWGRGIRINNEDITIRENFLDTGNGARYQMIFGHNETLDENGFIFSDILIEGNVLFGANTHSIGLSDTNNVTVRNNTLIRNSDAYEVLADGSTPESWHDNRISISGTNAVIENNIAQEIFGGGENAILTAISPTFETEYSAHFVNVEAAGSGDLRDLMLLADSPLNGVMGSWLTWSTDTAETLTAVADVTASLQDRSVVTLDASLSRGPDGYVAEQGAVFTWIFGDGTRVEGVQVTHDFGAAGVHSYNLSVLMPDGTTDEITRTIEIGAPLIARLASNGQTLSNIAPEGGSVVLHENATIDSDWISIGGRDRVELTRETSSLYNLTEFNIGMTVEVEPGSAGTLLHMHRTLNASVNADGYLTIALTTLNGTFRLTSETAMFSDDGAHVLNVIYDGDAQVLSLLVDGQTDAYVVASGTTPSMSHWGLTIGDAWQTSVEAQVSDIYVLNEAITLNDALGATPELMEPLPAGTEPSDDETAGPAVEETPVRPNGEGMLLSLDFDGATPEYGPTDVIDVTLHNPTDADVFVANGDRQFFDLSNGASLSTESSDNALWGMDSFLFNVDVRSDAIDGRSVFGIHRSFGLDIEDHDLVFWMETDSGTFVVESDGDLLADGDWHQVDVGYSDAHDRLFIVVDGFVEDVTFATGTTLDRGAAALAIGSQWDEGFSGAIDNFSLFATPEEDAFNFA